MFRNRTRALVLGGAILIAGVACTPTNPSGPTTTTIPPTTVHIPQIIDAYDDFTRPMVPQPVAFGGCFGVFYTPPAIVTGPILNIPETTLQVTELLTTVPNAVITGYEGQAFSMGTFSLSCGSPEMTFTTPVTAYLNLLDTTPLATYEYATNSIVVAEAMVQLQGVISMPAFGLALPIPIQEFALPAKIVTL